MSGVLVFQDVVQVPEIQSQKPVFNEASHLETIRNDHYLVFLSISSVNKREIGGTDLNSKQRTFSKEKFVLIN
jgi:hypothetical protein